MTKATIAATNHSFYSDITSRISASIMMRKLHSSSHIFAHLSWRITLAALIIGGLAFTFRVPILALACTPPQNGNFTLSQSCTFPNSSQGNLIDGVYQGDMIIPEGVTLTVNANQTVCWYPGKSIQLNGGNIAINATGQLKECDVVQTMMASLGLDVYSAGEAARIYDNNFFVCNSYPCTATAPSAAGNLIVEGVIKMAGGSPGAGKVLTSDANGVASWQSAADGGGWSQGTGVVFTTTGTDKVGIGTTDPDELLQVAGSAAGTGAHIGNAYTGVWDGGTSWAAFTHDSLKATAASYALLQAESGRTLVNAATGQDIIFRINNADQMSLSTSGLGIGTTSPAYKLHVAGDIYANGWLRSNGATGWLSESYGGGIYMTEPTWVRTYNNKGLWTNTGLLGSNGGLTIGYGGAAPPSTGAIIAGQVGIGTSSTGGYQLAVNSITRLVRSGQNMGSNNTGALEIHNNNDGGAAFMSFHRGGQWGAHFGLDTDNWLSTRGWSAGTNGYTNLRVGRFSAVGEGHLFGLASFDFATYPFGMVVNKIDYVVALFSRNNSGAVAQFNSNGGANSCAITPSGFGSVACSSDIRLKKNIEPLDATLDKVLALKPVYYNWKTEADGDQRHIGFIAQDVEKIYPNLVTEDEMSKNKILALDGFIPMIIKAIQEQQGIIDDLLARVEQLEKGVTGIDTGATATPVKHPVGTTLLPASSTRVFVPETRITTETKVFLTARVATDRTLSVTDIRPGTGFTLVSSHAGQNISVDYVLVN